MADALLSQREFDTWRDGDKEFKDQLLTHMQAQTQLNLKTEGRLTTLEGHKSKSDTRVSIISSLVSAIVGGVAGAFSWRL